MNIRDRIVSLRRVRASELRPNPANWRTHPQAQQEALRGILAEVGYVDALLARELPDKSLMLLDGHLRAETTPDAEVPVLVVDLTDEEAAKVLATFDPLAAMAQTDTDKLDALLREVETGSDALAAMLTELAGGLPIDFESPPETVQENAEQIENIKNQRRKGNKDTESKNDTEKYLVIVYPSREAREAELTRLGLPTDERYVAAAFVKIDRRGVARPVEASRKTKAASAKKSGAGG